MKKQINLSYGILNTIQNAIFPLVTLPYVLQTVGPELYGKNLHAALFHQLFSFLFILAVNPYALRLFSHAMGGGRKAEEEKIFSRIVSFQFMMSSVATVLQFFVIAALELLTPLYALYIFITFFSFMNVEWLFQAKQDYKTIFFRTLLLRSLVLGCLFVFVKSGSDFEQYNLIIAFSLISPAIISFLIARQSYKFKIGISNIKDDLFGAKYFYANGAVGSIYSYLDQVVIGLLVTSKELAVLNLIKTLASTIMSIPNMVNRFIMPDAFKSFKAGMLFYHHSKYFTLMLICLVVGLSLFCFIGLPVISTFLGEDMNFKQSYIFLIAASVFCTSLAVYIDTQSSVILGLEKITTISNLIVATISPLTTIILFSNFTYISPFIGMIIGEFCGVLVMIYMHVFIFKTNFIKYA
ncbi:oligosaccharide flippase family protein [Aeromonas bivalvium]|uniref:oligosaccharide flippase family protein n=1 Tax=Aeromonas bivalvium TaxID=440079 RepID=UPI000A0582CD|nr:oligosaccharide flippase family protein [Aeromonas bivalvium]